MESDPRMITCRVKFELKIKRSIIVRNGKHIFMKSEKSSNFGWKSRKSFSLCGIKKIT